MAADPNQKILATQAEKPNHYTYLKEFRVEQCPSFLQHKCNQHRPFICFNWHFMNQRRRRPVRKRDGTFNYSADNYCTKYDETTGICPDGDECPFLHRTAGDTERRYHLRYYKTCMCVHDTDTRGYCVKNGHHCAFAHGVQDQRPPVYDIKELEALQTAENNGEVGANGPNALDKERNLMNEDPKWQDTNYVLANYKTEPCKRPPRLCRQGYACPQYHNSKDKRRSPRKYKYRSTPCPNVKHGEEWGEPANCESGDNCQYCHTRTEQQFHPEIYKSTKCNDVQQAGYCPRSVFCAFAHVEPFMSDDQRDLEGIVSNLNLSNNIFNSLAHDGSKKDKNDLNCSLQNGSNNGESSESASTSSLGSTNSSHNKAPGSQLQQQKNNMFPNCNPSANHNSSNPLSQFTDYEKQLLAIDNDSMLGPLEKDQRKRLWILGLSNNLDGRDLLMMENSLSSSMLQQNSHTAPVNIPGAQLNNSIAGLFHSGGGGPGGGGSAGSIGASTTAPVNIPGTSLTNFSPTNHHLFGGVGDPFGHHHLSGSAPKVNPSSAGGGSVTGGGGGGGSVGNSVGVVPNHAGVNNNNSFGPSDSIFFQPQLISPNIGDALSSISPDLRLPTDLNSIRDELQNNSTSLFDNGLSANAVAAKQQQQQQGPYGISPCLQTNPMSEYGRLKDELASKNAQLISFEEQTSKAYESFKIEMDECKRKTAMAEQQRDEALRNAKALKEKLEMYSVQNGPNLNNGRDLRAMSLPKLKELQSKLRSELEEVEKTLYSETAAKCMKCEENKRSVTLPCNHFVLCDVCVTNVIECPYCQKSFK